MKTRQHPDAASYDEPNGSGSKIAEAWAVAKYSSVGIEIGIAIFIGWWVGQWLDKKLGTTPWLMFFCFLIGVLAAFKGLMRSAKEASAKLDKLDGG